MIYCVDRGMLGAAHVLAMDSKNLLDVVDTIRIRYPHHNKKLYETNSMESEQQQQIVQPTPVTCTFMQIYPQTSVQTTASSSSSTNQAVDSS